MNQLLSATMMTVTIVLVAAYNFQISLALIVPRTSCWETPRATEP